MRYERPGPDPPAGRCRTWIGKRHYGGKGEVRDAPARGDEDAMKLAGRMRIVWLMGLGAVLALGTLACAGGSPSISAETVSASAAFNSAEEAVRSVAESQGAAYAGDCASTRSPQDVGKICSKLIET